jgi:hypothetical protein
MPDSGNQLGVLGGSKMSSRNRAKTGGFQQKLQLSGAFSLLI